MLVTLHDLRLCNAGVTNAIRALEQSMRARERLIDTLRTAHLDRRTVRLIQSWLRA